MGIQVEKIQGWSFNKSAGRVFLISAVVMLALFTVFVWQLFSSLDGDLFNVDTSNVKFFNKQTVKEFREFLGYSLSFLVFAHYAFWIALFVQQLVYFTQKLKGKKIIKRYTSYVLFSIFMFVALFYNFFAVIFCFEPTVGRSAIPYAVSIYAAIISGIVYSINSANVSKNAKRLMFEARANNNPAQYNGDNNLLSFK